MSPAPLLILSELLSAGDDYVSGNRLAELANVSRVSIHGHMEKLRAQGFEFDAQRSKGYRLRSTPDELNETLIQARLHNASFDFRAIVLDETDSTNSEAERLLANQSETPFVLLARRQSSGRGRLGRVWHSPENGNLYASFAFRPEISPSQLALFTLWMGLNICQCVNAHCRVDCKVKWPNDLHIGGKKVAGILTEARMETDQVRDIVLGIGLNVNGDGSDWPDALRPIATTLRQAAGRSFDLNKLVAALTGRISLAYQALLEGSHKQSLKEQWPAYDTLVGQDVTLLQGDTRIQGRAAGIDASGSLIIDRPDGTRHHARAGEVTLEK